MGVLCALFLICAAFVGVTALTSKTETADAASAWGSLVINPDTGNFYYQYSSDTGTLMQVTEHGVIINIEIVPTNVSTYNFVDLSFGPSNAMLWASQYANGDLYFANNEAKGSGRFFLRLRTNTYADSDFVDNYGLGMWMHLPNGGTGISSNYQLVANAIWNENAGWVFNVCIRIVKVNGKWDIFVNDLDLNALGNSVAATYPDYADFFDTYVGGAFKDGNNQMDFSIINPQGADIRYMLGLGEMRGLTEEEALCLQGGRPQYLKAYTSSSTSYYAANSNSYVQLSRFGGYIDLKLNCINRPWEGYMPQIQVGFSPDSAIAYDDASLSTGKFYFNIMYQGPSFANGADGIVYIAPHFTSGLDDGWLPLVTGLNSGVVDLKFVFKAGEGGWIFLVVVNDNFANPFNFTYEYSHGTAGTITGFRNGVEQANNAFFTSPTSYQINFGVKGDLSTAKCNYMDVYYAGSKIYNGYDVKSNGNAVMEVLNGSPSNRVSYYDDAAASAGYMNIPADTAFEADFNVTLTEVITAASPVNFQIAFGDDSVVMNNDSSQTDTGLNHFLLICQLRADGIMYAQVKYNNGSGDACAELTGLGATGTRFANLQGANFGFSISIHKVSAVTSLGEDLWGIYVSEVMLDAKNFSYVISRAATPFMSSTTKNIAMTLENTASGSGGYVSTPMNLYMTAVAAYDYNNYTVNAGVNASVSDLKNSSGVDMFNDAVTVASENDYFYYDATTDTNNDNVVFSVRFTYDSNVNYVIKLRTTSKDSADSPTLYIMGGEYPNFYFGTLNFYVIRSAAKLVSGTTYDLYFGALTLAGNSEKARISVSVMNPVGAINVECYEGVFDIGTTDYTANGVVLHTFDVSTTFSSNMNRIKFMDRDGASELAYARYFNGATTTGVPEAPTVTNYTFRAWEDESGNAYAADQVLTSNKVYYAKYNFTNESAVASTINVTENVKYNPTYQIWVRDGSVEQSIMFVNNVTHAAYNWFDSQVAAGYISGYKFGTLITARSATADSMKIGASGVRAIESNGYLMNNQEKDAVARYIAAGLYGIPSDNYNTTITSRIYLEITQTDGSTTYFYGSLNAGSLAAAAATALNAESGYYTEAQLTEIASYVNAG